MNFDVYFPFQRKKDGKWCPGVQAKPMSFSSIMEMMKDEYLNTLSKEYRNGDASAKLKLPAVDWVGVTKSGKRLAEDCEPTQYVMLDIDHCEDPRKAWEDIKWDIEAQKLWPQLLLVHITPSGKGLRIVFRAMIDSPSLVDHMNDWRDRLNLTKYGDFDGVVKDFSRLSFCTHYSEVLYSQEIQETDDLPRPIDANVVQGEEKEVAVSNGKNHEEEIFDGNDGTFSDEEIEKFENLDYRGIQVKVIINKYVETFGQPSSGEIHNYYNEMVKNFRCITSNDKRALLYLLPRFGHSLDECYSQIKSICRVNTLSSLPKQFYFFLKDNGFYESRNSNAESVKHFMLDETEEIKDRPPYLPPVFREFVNAAPDDFVLPSVNALLPILGTLTSYLGAVYPYDNREHTTSFFSVIYAPPGTGKGFVERFMDTLFEDLRMRDFVQSERENVYLRVINRRGANDKAPDMPHTSLRIIPAKNSEAEFLQKQRDNHGYHMFTYAAEMDSWAKGVRAAGGNKDDMVRIAWDNGEYGQQFKAANTFKGTVRLYWNVLITGTIAQVENYFKNVENGLVTRCSFTSIDNQEFAEPPVWRAINKKGMQTIRQFMKRCDERTYATPCGIDFADLESVSDDDFDNQIDWKFKFRPRQIVDMSWVMPIIDKFHKEQMKLGALDIDRARDVFRRRVGVRGFRLGLICMGLWENPRQSDLEKCKAFIWWWMHKDIESMLRLWGAKYNELTDTAQVKVQRTVFDALGETFTKNDIYAVCVRQGIKTPVRRIVHEWTKMKYVERVDKETFKKKKS